VVVPLVVSAFLQDVKKRKVNAASTANVFFMIYFFLRLNTVVI
jgi:hypothetical protein